MIDFKKNKTGNGNKFKVFTSFDALMLVGGFIVVILILVPFASNGFWFDDALNSQVYYGLQRLHGDLGDFSWRVVSHWVQQEGRLMFGFFYGYPLFYLFTDLFTLRLAHCIAIVINIVIFGYVMWLLGATIRFLIIWAILLVGLFQISGSGLNPVAGFAFHYPVLGTQLAIVLIFFVNFLSFIYLIIQ